MGRYDSYMNNPNSLVAAYGKKREEEQGSAFPQSNAPAAPQPASQGALQGEAPSGAEPAFSLPSPGDEGKGVGEARKPEEQQGKDFYSFFTGASDDERDELTKNVLEPIEASGMSGEGAVAAAFSRDPKAAMEVGAKFGWVPPAEQGGMPGFKTQEAALADYQDAQEKEKRKKEKRQAIGGFLFEMGLRILASNRPDAGGAIAEGALGTIEARRQRKLQEEDREYELGEREESATDRERRRKREDKGAEYAESGEERAKAEEKRRQEAHNAKMKLGDAALGGRHPTAFEVQWGFYKEAYGGEDMDREEEQELRQKFLKYYNREDRMSSKEREAMITQFIKYNDDNPDDEWFDMSGKEKRAYAIESMGLDQDDEDADDDPLGLR